MYLARRLLALTHGGNCAPTSHLDAVNEVEVRQARDRLMVRHTTIVIAQRLSTVRDADRIVMLDAGHVSEQGTHMQLLARDGLYSALVAHQVRRAGLTGALVNASSADSD